MPPADPPKAEDFYRGFKQGTGFQLPEDTTVSIFLTAWVACCIFIRRVCYERILLKSAKLCASSSAIWVSDISPSFINPIVF